MIANPIPYKIVSDNLIIRCYQPEDVFQLNEKTNRSKEHLQQWLAWAREAPCTIEHHVAVVRRMRSNYDKDIDYTMGIFEKKTGELVGGSGLHPYSQGVFHIGYWVDVMHQKKGVVTENVRALTQVALNYLNLPLIQIHNGLGNIASRNIPQRLGFMHEAILRNGLVISETEIYEREIWSMNKQEFDTNPQMHMSIECFDILGRKIYSS